VADAYFPMKRGDLLPILSATLTASSGSAVSLVSKTVQFVMRPITAASNSAPVISAAASIVNAPGGQVSYIWQTGDTDHAGISISNGRWSTV
jgi:hypothetical protein